MSAQPQAVQGARSSPESGGGWEPEHELGLCSFLSNPGLALWACNLHTRLKAVLSPSWDFGNFISDKMAFYKKSQGTVERAQSQEDEARGGQRAGAVMDRQVLPAPRGQGSHQTAGRHPAPRTRPGLPAARPMPETETREEGELDKATL